MTDWEALVEAAFRARRDWNVEDITSGIISLAATFGYRKWSNHRGDNSHSYIIEKDRAVHLTTIRLVHMARWGARDTDMDVGLETVFTFRRRPTPLLRIAPGPCHRAGIEIDADRWKVHYTEGIGWALPYLRIFAQEDVA